MIIHFPSFSLFFLFKEEEHDQSESDEDAEPTSIPFQDSKKNVLDRVRLALRQIEKDKQEVKKKRRQRDELFKEQKVFCSVFRRVAVITLKCRAGDLVDKRIILLSLSLAEI